MNHDELTSERKELADAVLAIDSIEGNLQSACTALNHVLLSPEDKARISAAVAKFADALRQHNVRPSRKKRIGKSTLRAQLREISAASNGVLERL